MLALAALPIRPHMMEERVCAPTVEMGGTVPHALISAHGHILVRFASSMGRSVQSSLLRISCPSAPLPPYVCFPMHPERVREVFGTPTAEMVSNDTACSLSTRYHVVLVGRRGSWCAPFPCSHLRSFLNSVTRCFRLHPLRGILMMRGCKNIFPHQRPNVELRHHMLSECIIWCLRKRLAVAHSCPIYIHICYHPQFCRPPVTLPPFLAF